MLRKLSVSSLDRRKNKFGHLEESTKRGKPTIKVKAEKPPVLPKPNSIDYRIKQCEKLQKDEKKEKPTIPVKPEWKGESTERGKPTIDGKTEKPTVLPKPNSLDYRIKQCEKLQKDGKKEKPTIPVKPEWKDYKLILQTRQNKNRTNKQIVSSKPESTRQFITNQEIKSEIHESAAPWKPNCLSLQYPTEKQDNTNDEDVTSCAVLSTASEKSLTESPLTTQTIKIDTSDSNVTQMLDSLGNIQSQHPQDIASSVDKKHNVINTPVNTNLIDGSSLPDTYRNTKSRKCIRPYHALPMKPDCPKVLRMQGKSESNESVRNSKLSCKSITAVSSTPRCSSGTKLLEVELNQYQNEGDGNLHDKSSEIKSLQGVSSQSKTDKISLNSLQQNKEVHESNNTSLFVTPVLVNRTDMESETNNNNDEGQVDQSECVNFMSLNISNDLLINSTGNTANVHYLDQDTYKQGKEIYTQEHVNTDASQSPTSPPQINTWPDQTNVISSICPSIKRQSEIENRVNSNEFIINSTGITSMVSNDESLDQKTHKQSKHICSTEKGNKEVNKPPPLPPRMYKILDKGNELSLMVPPVKRQNVIEGTDHKDDKEVNLQEQVGEDATQPPPLPPRMFKIHNEKNEASLMAPSVKRQNVIGDTDHKDGKEKCFQENVVEDEIEPPPLPPRIIIGYDRKIPFLTQDNFEQRKKSCESDSDLVPVSTNRLGDVHETETFCMSKFDFTPVADGDLNLVQGSMYEILNQTTYEHWWKVRDTFGETGYIPSNCLSKRSELAKYSWYYRSITTAECADILNMVRMDGCFMIRDAGTDMWTYMYTLSVFCCILDIVYHYHIENSKGRFCLKGSTEQFDTIPELVKYHKQFCGGMLTRLKSPPPLTYKVKPRTIVINAEAILNRWKMDKNDLEIGAYIGSGRFGRIRKGTLGGSAVAVETIRSTQLSHTELYNEFSTLSRLSHPNLLHLYGVVTDSDSMLKVTELIEYGNLATYLRQHKLGLMNKFDILITMCLQVCSGMVYLHSRNYIHGCLTARSCRVGTNRTVKIADLSGAKEIVGREDVRFSKCFVKWASPEVIRTGMGGKKADVWSFGILMWEIFTCGMKPYAHMTTQQCKHYVTELDYCLPQPVVCPLLIYEMMMCCWNKYERDRPTFQDLFALYTVILNEGAEECSEEYVQAALSDLDPREMHLFALALNEGEENDNFIRVMVVGNFNQGKTSLTRRLLSLDLDGIDSTDGIDILSANCGTDAMIWTKNDIHKNDEICAHRLANVVKFRESPICADDASVLNGETLKAEFTTTCSSQQNTNESCVPSSGNQEENNDNQTTDQSYSPEKKETASHIQDSRAVFGFQPFDVLTYAVDASSEPDSTDTDSSEEPDSSVDVPLDTNVAANIKDRNLFVGFMQKIREHKGQKSKEKDHSIHVNIWDFGGQFVYYATHQIFHSRDAIYLLVFDLTKDLDSIVDDDDFPDRKTIMKESLRFWVSSVHAFVGSEDGHEPKIILVGTHKSACRSNIEIEQRFDDVLDLFADSKARNHIYRKPLAVENTNPNDPSFKEIKKAIYDIGLERAQNTKVPAKWIQLEVAMKEARQIKILRFEDVVDIDASTGYPIRDEKQLKVFLKYHHAKGSLVYFDENYLCDYVIIDPQFLVDAFKCIITSKRFCKWRSDLHCLWEKLKATAVLEKQLINGVWESDKTNHFAEHKDVLIAFLQRHRIISEIQHIDEITGEQEGIGKYIVPSLLKAECDDKMLARVIEGKESFCSKILLGLSFEDSAILRTVFEKVTAAALGRWPPLDIDGKNLIFLNDAFFRVDLQHAVRIAKKEEKGLELMVFSQCPPVTVSGVVCDRFRRYLETVILHEFQRVNSARSGKPFVYYLKCNHVDHMGMGSRNSHDNIDNIVKRYRVCCPDNAGHSVIVKDAMSEWFQGETVTKLEEVPKRKVTEKDLSGVAQAIAGNWELFGTCLGLGAVEVEQIKMDHRFTQTAIYYMLLSWKSQYPTNDTLYDLIEAMNKCEALTVDWDKIKNILDNF